MYTQLISPFYIHDSITAGYIPLSLDSHSLPIKWSWFSTNFYLSMSSPHILAISNSSQY